MLSGQAGVAPWQDSLKRSILPSPWRASAMLRAHPQAGDRSQSLPQLILGLISGLMGLHGPPSLGSASLLLHVAWMLRLSDSRHDVRPMCPLSMTMMPEWPPVSALPDFLPKEGPRLLAWEIGVTRDA